MDRKTLDFLASPGVLILGLLVTTGITGNIGLKEPAWVGGPICIILLIIYFSANSARDKLLTKEEKEKERRWDEPHGRV